MQAGIEQKIVELEQQLQQAMLHSDSVLLDKLLSEDLLFTNHLGQCMSKQDDLTAHQTQLIIINDIQLSDMKIKTHETFAIVSVKAYISGVFAGELSTGNFRFTRVWYKNPEKHWQVIAGHASVIS